MDKKRLVRAMVFDVLMVFFLSGCFNELPKEKTNDTRGIIKNITDINRGLFSLPKNYGDLKERHKKGKISNYELLEAAKDGYKRSKAYVKQLEDINISKDIFHTIQINLEASLETARNSMEYFQSEIRYIEAKGSD